MNAPGLLLATCLLAPLADGERPHGHADEMSTVYRAEAEGLDFYRDAKRNAPLKLVDHPMMRWTSAGEWSGEVYVWTLEGRPEVIGCMLSGPADDGGRFVLNELHLVSDKPIAPAALRNGKLWNPERGIASEPLIGAPAPAPAAPARLTQMRRIASDCSAYMHFESESKLRLLPQPLFRYGADETDIRDGAIFAYVSTIGTDPELILLLECRRNGQEFAWHFAPVRFSTRELWLQYRDRELWRVDPYQEPSGVETTSLYTIGFSRMVGDRDSAPRAAPERTTKPADSDRRP